MTSVYFDPLFTSGRRWQLYEGDIFVFSPRPSTMALVNHARNMIEEVYGDDPCRAQFKLPVETFSSIGAALKPRFIHHPQTKILIQKIVADVGCDLEDTYLDVPRLRLASSNGYLTTGVGFAFYPHRDTWWSAPMAQLNWWMPIYEFERDAGMAFHPRYMHAPVANSSDAFNYYSWNADGRKNAGQHVGKDTRIQPKPLQDVELEPQIRPICDVGGIIVFSGASLHSTVPNTSGITRFSIDFRTVNRCDLEEGRGPVNVDSRPTGTSLRDFVRGTDFSPLPAELIARYDSGDEVEGGVFVFTPDLHDKPATPQGPEASTPT
jgi:hypothetical protein